MIKVFQLKNIGDQKGSVINLDFSQSRIVEIPVFYRKKGSNPEGHFHEGTDPSCNPQIIYILKGSIELTCIDPSGNKETIVIKERHGIEVPKLVYHKYKTLEYTIFCEPRLEKYDANKIDKKICHPEEYLNLVTKIVNYD